MRRSVARQIADIDYACEEFSVEPKQKSTEGHLSLIRIIWRDCAVVQGIRDKPMGCLGPIAEIGDRCPFDDLIGAITGSESDLRQPRTGETVVLGEKICVWQTTVLAARIFRLQAVEKEHFVRAFVLDHDGTARFQIEQPLDVSGDGFRDVDPSRDPKGFHEPRGVNRVAPDIKGQPAVTDHT